MEGRIETTKILQLENSYEQLPSCFYTNQYPEVVPSPKIVLLNKTVCEELQLDYNLLQSEEAAQVLSGNKIIKGTNPIAQAYAGHQFGYFTMLGDGRAILLGECVTNKGNRLDIQLKGSGRTPYSRGGDGKASLGPMLREYIISEGMHGLGIPTTRSLAVLTTGENVFRETPLPGAILVRVAKSHIRVGTFEYASHFRSQEELKQLADYTIKRHYPQVQNEANLYLGLLREVIKAQASLIAQWQSVGFIHGVMNTDNMTISGETIDYGPCAFMDQYDPKTVFSSIDTYGRYAYQNQPKIGLWNLTRFAETLVPFLANTKEEAIEIAKKELGGFSKLYQGHWYERMRNKLGLSNEEEMDEHLIEALFSMMQKYQADFNHTFYQLTAHSMEASKLSQSIEFSQWQELWESRRLRQDITKEESDALMRANNPTIIPRNHRVEEALELAVENGDYSLVNSLVQALQNPYDYEKVELYYQMVPTGCSGYKTYCGT